MVCEKCGYKDLKYNKIFGKNLCRICSKFSPNNPQDLNKYLEEKVDWKILEPFRNYQERGIERKKEGMNKRAKVGILVSRAPLGYEVIQGNLVPNEDSSKIHSLFKTFLNRAYSLNSLAKNFSLSVNGLKKVLSNRTYLGEIKFDGKIFKGTHKPLISPEIFYAVQRKLKEYLRPRKKQA